MAEMEVVVKRVKRNKSEGARWHPNGGHKSTRQRSERRDPKMHQQMVGIRRNCNKNVGSGGVHAVQKKTQRT